MANKWEQPKIRDYYLGVREQILRVLGQSTKPTQALLINMFAPQLDTLDAQGSYGRGLAAVLRDMMLKEGVAPGGEWGEQPGPTPKPDESGLPIHGAPYGPRDPEAWVRTPTPGGIVVTPKEKGRWEDQPGPVVEETEETIKIRGGEPTGPVLPSPANWKGSVVDYARAVRDWVKAMRRTGSDIDYSVMLTGPLNWLEGQGGEGKTWADWLRSSILPTSPWSEWHKPTPAPKPPAPKPPTPQPTPWIDQPTPLPRITPDERTEETVFPGLDRYPRPPQPNIPTPKPEFPAPGRPPKVRTAFENIWAWRKKKPLWW